MRYVIEKMNLPWGLVVVEGVEDQLEPLTDPDAGGIWTDGGTIMVFAFDPTRIPVSVSIQNEISSDPDLTRVFDGHLEVDDDAIRIGDLNDNSFVVGCTVPVEMARVVVDIDQPKDGSRLTISIPDMTGQRVEADRVTRDT